MKNLLFLDGDGAWTQPSDGSIDNPVIYRQFEDSVQLTLHNGAVIFPGKVTLFPTIAIRIFQNKF